MTVGVVERRPPLIISASGVAATSSRPAAVIRIVPFLLSHVCVGGTVWGWAPSSSFGSVVPLALGRHLGQFQQESWGQGAAIVGGLELDGSFWYVVAARAYDCQSVGENVAALSFATGLLIGHGWTSHW